MKKTILFLVVAAVCLAFAAPLFAEGNTEKGPMKVGVFVPGVAAGSPLYEQLVSGANKVAAEFPNLTIKVVEAGFDQSKWPEQMTALAATGEYTWILTSNPSMPDVSKGVFTAFPKQKFIFMDGYLSGNPMAYSVMYNQVEQGYMAGYLAGLVTKSTMKGATPELKVGAIVAQEYPALTKEMIPGYKQGFEAVDPNITLDYRVIGNWWDANKARRPRQQHDGRGRRRDPVHRRRRGPGHHQGGAGARPLRRVLRQQRVQDRPGDHHRVRHARPGAGRVRDAEEGRAGQAGVRQGRRPQHQGRLRRLRGRDPLYTNNVAADVVAKMADLMKKFRNGSFSLAVPQM